MAGMQAVNAVQAFCHGLVEGVAVNISFLVTLWQPQEIQQPAVPAKRPETELARRRAERQQAKRETPQTVNQTVIGGNTRRSKLLVICGKNIILSLLCILLVSHALKPGMHYFVEAIAGELTSSAEWAMDNLLVVLWLAPMFLLIKFVNIFWMTDLANDAYKEKRGRPAPSEVTMFFSDIVYTTILQVFFILQILLFAMIPVSVQGFNIFELILTAISYALYAFEYKWMNMGYDVRRRLDLIDRNLGYHIGFGLPLSFIVLFFENFWIRFIFYSTFFPFLIVCANDATEPLQRRGRSTPVFLLPERSTHFCFWLVVWLVKTFGLKRAVNLILWLLVLGAVYYLGIVPALLSLLPVDAIKLGCSQAREAALVFSSQIREQAIELWRMIRNMNFNATVT